jgi:hypothetical protein
MFDIYGSYEYNPSIFDNMQMEINDIDDDISSDIENLLANRFDSLYLKDIYKKNNICIDIIYPSVQYGHHRVLLKSPDYIRFLLSLYPFSSDLENLQKIVCAHGILYWAMLSSWLCICNKKKYWLYTCIILISIH